MAQTVLERVAALFGAGDGAEALTVHMVGQDAEAVAALPAPAGDWAAATGFSGEPGAFTLVPGADGRPVGALFGIGRASAAEQVGALPRRLPARFGAEGPPVVWALSAPGLDPAEAALEWALGAYRFERYKRAEKATPLLLDPAPQIGAAAMRRVVETAVSVFIGRNLVNTPASDLGPEELEAVVAAQAERHGAAFHAIAGEALLEENLPMIHAVGRAAPQAPRLLDLRWGDEDAPKLTLVGKGVCFDTGGLNLKPGGSMRLMKKDMGGAAASLALARMVMTLGLPVRLRLLIPAVENSLDGAAFRPGDVLTSRKGLTVEIDNTDAEGRLVLADAMTLADEEAPDLLLDMATLTGAARVALGPEIAPFYTADDDLAAALSAGGAATRDPLWRMPLWDGYDRELASSVADCVNSAKSGFGGSITAALFLRRFVEQAKAWAHFDIFAWNPKNRPGRPEGGEASAARAVFHALERRFGAAS